MLHLGCRRRSRRPCTYLLGEIARLRSHADPDGLGFDGIAVALLGRNHPVGIVVSALLFGFLDSLSGAAAARRDPAARSSIVIKAIILLTRGHRERGRSTRWVNRRTADRTAAQLARRAEVAA